MNIFVKTNFLLSISFILLTLSYDLSFYSVKTLISRNPILRESVSLININPYIVIFYLLFVVLLSDIGFTLGSLFKGGASYSYTILVKYIQIIIIISIYNVGTIKQTNLNIKTLKIIDWNTLIPIILFFILVLIGGDRGPVISLVLMILIGFLSYNNMYLNRRYFLLLLILIIFFYYLMSVVANLRLLDGSFNLLQLDEAMQVQSESELRFGFSSLATNLALEGINENLYPHTYGFLFIQSIIKGIPFLGNLINTAIIGESSVYNVGSAGLLTYQYLGSDPIYGIGTTYLADLYIEFGLLGIIVGSIILGLFVAHLDKKLIKNQVQNIYFLILVYTFIGQSFYLGRSSMFGFIPHFMSIIIFYYIIQLLSKIFRLNEKRIFISHFL